MTALTTRICHFGLAARGRPANRDCSGRCKEVKQKDRQPEEAAACPPESPVTPNKVVAEKPEQQHELINVTKHLKQKPVLFLILVSLPFSSILNYFPFISLDSHKRETC